jgi:exo-beta-1,3-glucanase (GH17 family)
MNIDDILATTTSWLRRGLLAGACLGLAACGQNQNYSQTPAFITIGGTVTGLVGTVTLNDNGVDPLTVVPNGNGSGTFTFALQLASGSAYSVTLTNQPAGQTCTLSNAAGTSSSNVTNIGLTCVNTPTISVDVTNLTGTLVLQDKLQTTTDSLTVKSSGTFAFPTKVTSGGTYAVTITTQPAGETCTVTSGSGTATANVTIAVSCAVFTPRALPAVYSTGKAVNYSAYRAGGPNAGEVPSITDVQQDLNLLQTAGYSLLRMFGADAVADEILATAATNNPTLQFQVGIYLEGSVADCSDAGNATQIAKGIELANKYPNVAAVSVGNETSFAGNLPVNCLVQYLQQVRAAVKQPVTADDDYTFYAGLAATGEKPDTVLQTLDFVSIHTYPFSNTGRWDWQQLAVAAGPLRAQAMMNAALAQAQQSYTAVANYPFKRGSGAATTVGAALPITIGETGWKATPTNPGAAIEAVANPAIANPVNAKWFNDLLGTWTGAGAPVAIFYFEAFDEAWKGTDDGWGLWDKTRTARYALCGTAAGTACASPVYTGAGYFH